MSEVKKNEEYYIEQEVLKYAYWLQKVFILLGYAYFDDEGAFFVRPYSKEGDDLPEGAKDLYDFADLIIRNCYEVSHSEYKVRFEGKTFEETKYIDKFKGFHRRQKSKEILKERKKEHNLIPGVREDKGQRSNTCLYMLKFIFFGDGECKWDEMIGILQYLVLTKQYKPFYNEFVRDFVFVLGFTQLLPLAHSKDLAEKGFNKIDVQESRLDNADIKKTLKDKLRKFKDYYTDDQKLENWLLTTLHIISFYTYQKDVVLCNGLSSVLPNEEEENEFSVSSIIIYSKIDSGFI